MYGIVRHGDAEHPAAVREGDVSVVRMAREGIYALARATGGMALVRRSRFRRERLLILCFHGVSLDDEHEWKPALFIRQEVLRERLRQLRDGGYSVVSLDDGVRRLRDGTLPRAAVALTFDDGTYDFYARAYPVLEEFGYPATVYQTTRYSEVGTPVFDVFVSYLLWKGRHRTVDLSTVVPGAPPGAPAGALDTPARRDAAFWTILRFADTHGLDEVARQHLAERLAAVLGIDFRSLVAKRIVSLMTPGEMAELAGKGIDFQLHTHRHRLFEEREAFTADLHMNRSLLEGATGRVATHFCYPSGVYRRDAMAWLREAGVTSATTCDPGLAAHDTPSLLLPRLVVTESLSPLTFESWASGLAELLPRRTRLAHPEAREP